MPSILLINDNKIVSRLLQLSSKKHNYDLEEISDYNPSDSAYNVVFVDSHKYNSSSLKNLMGTIKYDKLGFIGSKGGDIPSEFDMAIEKPFLPTDFVSLIDEHFKVVDSFKEEDTKEDTKLDELEELSPIDKKVEEQDETLDELEIPKTTLSTGIANALHDEDEKTELSDMVSEIDHMIDEEPIEDLSLEDLKIDESVDDIKEEKEDEIEKMEDLSLEDLKIDDSIDTIKEDNIKDDSNKDSLDIPEDLIEPLAEKEEVSEDKEDKSSVAEDLVTTASVLGVGGVVANALKDDKDKEEEIGNMIDELDGIEDIEKDSDYIANELDNLDEKEIVQALEDDLDSLDETPKEEEKLDTPIVSAMSKVDDENKVEEIISEEISTDGEERVVEPTDLEDMIQKAVANSITPELLQKALEGMDINLSLSFSPKNKEIDS